MSQYSAHTASGATSPLITRLTGWCASETAGAAAVVNLRSGTVTGTIIARINLAADGTHAVGLATELVVSAGVYVEVNSGAAQVDVYGE